MDRIEAMRSSMLEAGAYSRQDIEEICSLEKAYDEACVRIARECKAEGYPAHGENYDLRCAQEREWIDEQIRDITEPYEEERRQYEEMVREATEKYGLKIPFEEYSPLQQRMLLEGHYRLEYIEDHELRERMADQWYREQLPGIEEGVEKYRRQLLGDGFYSAEDVEKLCGLQRDFEVGCAAANRDCIKEGYVSHGQEYSDRHDSLMAAWTYGIDEVNAKYGPELLYRSGDGYMEEPWDRRDAEEEDYER